MNEERAAIIKQVWEETRHKADFSKHPIHTAVKQQPFATWEWESKITSVAPVTVEMFQFYFQLGCWSQTPVYHVSCDGLTVEIGPRPSASSRPRP